MLTASSHLYVDACLDRLGVGSLFEKIWTVDDFGISKAEPEIYVKAAERLGVSAGDCVFFDDNITAVRTSKKAGMRAAAVYDKSSASYEAQMRSAADAYLYSLDDWREI